MASASFRGWGRMALSGKSKSDAFAVFCRKRLAEGTTSPKELARLAERSEPEIFDAVISNSATRIEDIEHLVREAAALYFRSARLTVDRSKSILCPLTKNVFPAGFSLARSFSHSWIARHSSPGRGCVVDYPPFNLKTC